MVIKSSLNLKEIQTLSYLKIFLYFQACKGHCTFDSGLCSFENTGDENEDDFNWWFIFFAKIPGALCKSLAKAKPYTMVPAFNINSDVGVIIR